MESSSISITIIDRDGVTHKVEAPTDMAMKLMEIVRSYELAAEGTIGVCGGYGYVCLMPVLCIKHY